MASMWVTLQTLSKQDAELCLWWGLGMTTEGLACCMFEKFQQSLQK